jgi:hypothetical protein
MFQDSFISFFNMIFTALPCFARAVFDTDVNYKYAEYYDMKEYKEGLLGKKSFFDQARLYLYKS